MSRTAEQVLEAALALSDDDRAEVAARLQESVGYGYFATPELAAEWKAEIARRIKEADEGGEPSIPAEEVFQKLREKYGVSFD
jgi:putative addiction module component (TIGR02574 family)